MILLSHPTGNVNASASARGLYRHQLLTAYYTCVSWNSESWLARLIPSVLTRKLERRRQPDIPSHLIKSRPWRELMRTLFEQTGIYGPNPQEDALFSTEQVYYDLDRYIARELNKYPKLRGIYAYDDGALAQFQQAQASGLKKIYDLPIGHWRALKAISLEEAEAQPAWSSTMKALTDTNEKNERKDAEIDLADLVLVASTFTQKTLELYPGKKQTVVIPYGMPAVTAPARPKTKASDPLRVLFVGALTQRKGISYLFEAVKKMGQAVTLTLIGVREGYAKVLEDECARHRWLERLPHSEVLAEMHRHDVLVFPSLFEGFGLVIGEALSQGLPVITTPHTGGPDILQDGREGFVVPIRSAEAIAEKLTLLHQDRELLKTMSDAARERANNSSWRIYEDLTAATIANLIGVDKAASADDVDGAPGSRRGLRQELIHGGVEVRS